jgi:hypothetical protein
MVSHLISTDADLGDARLPCLKSLLPHTTLSDGVYSALHQDYIDEQHLEQLVTASFVDKLQLYRRPMKW